MNSLETKICEEQNYHDKKTAHRYIVTYLLPEITKQRLSDVTSFRLSKSNYFRSLLLELINPLTPNDPYRGRTAPLTTKRCILYIYSTNISTEYFKQVIYFPFFLFKM